MCRGAPFREPTTPRIRRHEPLYLAVRRHDYDDHDALPKQLDGLKGVDGTLGAELKELRLRRNEFDYSPYPGAKPGTPYPSKQRTSIIKDSVRRADRLVRALDKFLKDRK